MERVWPEHEKLHKVAADSQKIGAFLDWLQNEQGVALCRFDDRHEEWRPTRTQRIEDVLAAYYGINLAVLEDEKRQMLDQIRAAHEIGEAAKTYDGDGHAT